MASFSISSDAELLWNVLPATALPSQSKVLTARDRNGHPMVFGIGTDSVLRVAQESPTTRLRQLVDLRPIIGRTAGALVNGFDLYQATDNTIYLSVAISENQEDRLLALKPFNPADVDFTDANAKLAPYKTVRLDDMRVKDVLVGTFVTNDLFPPIIINYTDVKKSSDNVKHYEVTDDGVVNQGDLSLPVNTNSITRMAIGKIKRHTGVFVLYTQGSNRQIMFSSWTTQFDNNLKVPANPGYIAAIPNSRGDTDLIVGGDGIWHYASSDMLARDPVGSCICDGVDFKGINDMHVAFTAVKGSIWVTTGNNGVSYVEIDASGLNGSKHPPRQDGVPLLAAGKGGGIAGFVGADGQNALLVSDVKNTMTYFEQAPDTKMWKQSPFWFPSPTETLRINSYMTRIVAHDKVGTPLPGSWITIASTGWVDVVVNGVPTKLGQVPISIQTDEDGSLNIINPTNDISSYHFIVSAVRDTDQPGDPQGSPVTINPTAKVDRTMSNVTADGLSKATTAEGDAVFQNCSQDQFKQAAAAIKEINSARDALAGSGVSSKASISSVKSGQVMNVTVAALPSASGAWGTVKNVFWDCWHFVTSSFESVKNWAVETYNNVKAFVIKIGEQAWRFVLETATQIAKAADFIWTKYLKAPFEKVVGWFQNLFSWKDIVETKNNIVDFINSTLDYGSTNLAWAADTVDSKFDGWKQLIKDNLAPNAITDTVRNKKAGPQAQDSVPSESKEKMGRADVKQNWTKYHLTHGGALKGSVIEDVAGGVVGQYQDTWDTIVKPVFDSLTTTMGTVGDDIALLFKKNQGITAGDILQKVGVDMLLGIVDLVKTLLVGVLKRMSLVVEDFKSLVNKKIKVPIFSDLWVYANKLFNKDVDPPTFTVIGFIGFVLAIPITLTCKVFTGKRPPSPKFNVKTLGQFFDNSAPASDKLSYNGFAALLEAAAGSALAVIGISSIFGLSGALAAIFDFQLLFGLVRVAVIFPTNRDLPLWELRCAASAADAVNVFVLAIARKVDKGGKGEKVLAGIEMGIAVLNICLRTAANSAELATDWKGKDEERTGYQILISVLGGASTIGKNVATISDEPMSKIAGAATKQVAGKASGFFNVVNTYGNIAKGKYTFILNSGS